MKIRVLIVDDHAVLRAGLSLLLNGQPDMAVAGEASDGNEAVTKAQETQPDIVLLDLSMPGAGGLAAIPLLKHACPGARVVVLSMHMEPAYMRAVFEAGAMGYVTKKAADREVLAAIRMVAQGRRFVCPACQEYLVETVLGGTAGQKSAPTNGVKQPLSEREQEVLILVARGYTNRIIADRLALSVKSVETYRSRLMEKLGLRTRAELVRYALATGLLRTDNLMEPNDPA